MTHDVNVPLSENEYRRFKRWADARQQDLGKAIADFLAEHIDHDEAALVFPTADDPQVAQEKAAYLQLHPQLAHTHAGKYVAIYDGKLVDHDDHYGALFERIDNRYPDTFVWLTRVENEPFRELNFRSPRFVRDRS